MSIAQASLADLEDVRNVLVEPLTGKSVMIPFTSKAFFPGVLQPERRQGGEEQVLVKLSKQDFLEVTRSEAIGIIEKRSKDLSNDKINDDKLATSSSNNKVPLMTPSAAAALPYFEIREELDASGKEIRSEAVNVAKELEFLQKKGQDMSQQTMKQPQTHGSETNGAIVQDTEPKQKGGVVTDEEYDNIVSRLDALAALEEESTSVKSVNKRSAKKLQGSGWAKGFLNKPNTKKKAAPPASVKQESATPRKVVFGNNKVKEIPRVGEKSVASFKKAPAAVQPFSTSVFTGVVQERPTVSAAISYDEKSTGRRDDTPRKLSRFAQQRMEQNEAGEGEQPKRISRFAQDRANQRAENS